MPKNNKSHDLLLIVIFCFICGAAWVGSNTFHQYTKKQKALVSEKLLKPLPINLEEQVFDTLEERHWKEDKKIETILKEEGNITPTPTKPTETPTTIPTPHLTPTPTPTTTPTPTPITTSPSPS